MKTAEEILHETVVNMAPEAKPEEVAQYEQMLQKVLQQDMTLKEAMQFSTNSLEVLYGYAYQLFNSGNYDKALLLFSLLSMIDPASVKYRMGIAACKHLTGDFKGAVDAYLGCVPLDPTNPMPLFHATDCWMQLKHPVDAAMCLRIAIAIGRKDPKYAGIVEQAYMLMKPLVIEMTAIEKQMKELQ